MRAPQAYRQPVVIAGELANELYGSMKLYRRHLKAV